MNAQRVTPLNHPQSLVVRTAIEADVRLNLLALKCTCPLKAKLRQMAARAV